MSSSQLNCIVPSGLPDISDLKCLRCLPSECLPPSSLLSWWHPGVWERDCVRPHGPEPSGLRLVPGQVRAVLALTRALHVLLASVATVCSWWGVCSVCFLGLPGLTVSCRRQSPHHPLLEERQGGPSASASYPTSSGKSWAPGSLCPCQRASPCPLSALSCSLVMCD